MFLGHLITCQKFGDSSFSEIRPKILVLTGHPEIIESLLLKEMVLAFSRGLILICLEKGVFSRNLACIFQGKL